MKISVIYRDTSGVVSVSRRTRIRVFDRGSQLEIINVSRF